MDETLSETIATAMRAYQVREYERAQELGLSVEQLHSLADKRTREADDLQRRSERLRYARRYVTDEDFARIVSRRLDTPAASAVSSWLDTSSAFLVLCGGRGTGKTVAALHAIASCGGQIVTSIEVGRAWRNEHDEARALRTRILNAHLLVIDDIGVELDKEAVKVALQEVVNARQSVHRTVITTNLSRAVFDKSFDDRTIERIHHRGVCVSVPGTSMREGTRR